MNCGTLSRLRQAAGLLALSKFATLAPQQYNRRADSYLARYAARNANFVHVVRPHKGLGARSAPKDAGLTSREALPGISRGEPLGWLDPAPVTGPHLKMRPTTQGDSTVNHLLLDVLPLDHNNCRRRSRPQ